MGSRFSSGSDVLGISGCASGSVGVTSWRMASEIFATSRSVA